MPESQFSEKPSKNPESTSDKAPKLPQSCLSTYAFLKKSYPLNDTKRVAKEAAIGAPSFIAGYAINAATQKAGSTLFPHLNLFKNPAITLPEKIPCWHRYTPLNALVNKNLVSQKTAFRFHAPISEELFFRGLLMPGMQAGLQAAGMKEKPAKIGSAIGNSLFFSALHPKTANRKAYFFCGLTYSALTYFAQGSLIPATAGHMANNHVALKLAERTFGKK